MRILKLIFAIFVSASMGCSAGPAPEPVPAADPAATLDRIRALVGTPSCTADSQCHSLALGARPCGGPEAYLPWSSAHAAADQVQALAARYKAEREAVNRTGGLVSDCRFQIDPGAVCRAGVCQPGGQAPLPN